MFYIFVLKSCSRDLVYLWLSFSEFLKSLEDELEYIDYFVCIW